MSSLTEQIEQAERELTDVRREVEKAADALKAAEDKQADADRRLLTARTSKEQDNKKLLELEGRLSSERTEETGLREQEDELVRSLDEVKRRLIENQPQLEELRLKQETLRDELTDLKRQKEAAALRQREIQEETESLEAEVDEATLKIGDITASIEACEARSHLLEDMMLQYEGYESGLVTVMENRERWPGIAGTVGEKFIPVEGLETTLEAALGDLAKCLVCYDRRTAEGIISYLKTENKGKIGILVPELGTINPAVKRPEIELSEFVGWLDGFVSTEENLRSMKEAVLSRTAVFKAGADPDELLKRLPYGFSAVSSDGVFYSRNLISGGSDDRFPLFRRREKVQQQQDMIRELNENLNKIKSERSRTETRVAGLRAESVKLTGKSEELAEEIEQRQHASSELEFGQRTITDEYRRLEKEQQNLNNRLESIRNRQYALGLDSTQLATEKDNLVCNLDRVGAEVGELEKAAAEAVELVSRLHVSLIETRSKAEQSESRISHLREIRKDIEATIQAKTEEVEQARTTIETSARTAADLEKELKSLFDNRDRLASRQDSLRAVQSEVTNRIGEKEKQVRQLREQRDAVLEDIHHLEIKINSIESEIKGTRDRLLEEYEVDINTVEAVSPDQGISDDQAREHLQAQKEKLKKFGAVNLLALEEYQSAHEREQFLDEQLNDLDTAKRDLQVTISKINRTARQLFLDTFNKVRDNFKSIFVELFRGGEADIMLVDPEDPLESAIDIFARPRGKKILSITQMSGGERALTAISLLFSLYLVKPSPFCILDEIDAPLDDANCHRFLKIIRNFSDQTQFIIITHNKITMEASDNLYGITMEEPGISQLVAVRFTDDDEHAVVEYQQEPSADAADGETDREEAELPQQVQERIHPTISIAPDEED
jgi:chromosome segregation protein